LQVILNILGECIFALPFGFVSLVEKIAGLIGLSEKQCNSRDAYKDCENPKHDWVKGLKVEPSELSGMNPEQPESIDVLLKQQAVERTCSSSDQQGSCCNGHHPSVDSTSAALDGGGTAAHCRLIC
jgi:hypothetical protein